MWHGLADALIPIDIDGGLRGLVANVLDFDIVVSEFDLQLRY